MLSLREEDNILNEQINAYKEMVNEIKSERCLDIK